MRHTGQAQLAIFARMISPDGRLKEELLDIVPLKDRTRGIDVKEAMMDVFKKPICLSISSQL
ncbi:General transcription factor II-I repeat domain-containing protein 2B [Caligus rogercresseyi]|uniref:General transcription factor II-I repeat domain-containing protein 2B n=1 Tax=Caligus rogercresseyi TaxID=217165 RepID=A0A7T8K9G4_CALRO|nr:General transcription factor II-I repeat domain-containing protein 2B [Caligus rogercresseyi]